MAVAACFTSRLTPPCLMPALPQPLMRRMFPAGLGPLSSVPRTGPSPVMARVSEWLRVIPRWEGISRQVSGLCSNLGTSGLQACKRHKSVYMGRVSPCSGLVRRACT